MRFVCDSCRAQYMISDDKIGAKGVKIRCKKCGHVIVVRPTGAAAPKDEGTSEASAAETSAPSNSTSAGSTNAAAALATLGTPPEGGLFTGVEEDEIGAVFDQVLNSGSHKIPAGEPVGDQARESKSSTPDAVRKLAEAESQPEEPKAAAPANDWYVAIDEKQVGPLTLEKIKEHWERGEVGPDSLCWRAGFSDWIPLSEVTELASALSPRPAKPVIVAPAAMASSAPSVSAPVESAFSAGAQAKNNRPEIPAAPALGQEPPSSGWKPSAASVLASLVKEENDAMSKPPPRPAAEEKPAAPGLLDLPAPEPALAPTARTAPMLATATEPMRAPQPAYAQPAPAYAQPAPAYAQPAYAPAGYPQPAYPGYPPSAVPGGQGGNKTVMVAAIAAGTVVVLLGLGVFVWKSSSSSSTSEPPVIAAVTPPSQQDPKTPEAATPPTPAPAEAKAQPAPNAGVANPSVSPTPAPGTTAPPATAPGTGVAAGGSPGTPPAATPTPPPATTPTPPAASEAVAKASPGTREPSRKNGDRNSGESSRPAPTAKPEAISKPSTKPADDGLGDDFDDLFGTKKPEKKPTGSQGGNTPSTYIPPEPGGGANVPERLGQSDIMAVVVANKPAIVKCVNEQKKKDPGLNGRLVMRWVIQPNGRTTGVSVKSEEFKKTYMASCISGLIKGWNFPKHKKQGDPIDFPFIF
jgi:predicted Zn finger-like uncharacterized protein